MINRFFSFICGILLLYQGLFTNSADISRRKYPSVDVLGSDIEGERADASRGGLSIGSNNYRWWGIRWI
jgi:hypothetical protein